MKKKALSIPFDYSILMNTQRRKKANNKIYSPVAIFSYIIVVMFLLSSDLVLKRYTQKGTTNK